MTSLKDVYSIKRSDEKTNATSYNENHPARVSTINNDTSEDKSQSFQRQEIYQKRRLLCTSLKLTVLDITR